MTDRPGSLPFEIITTADGSPTARFGDNETMHSLRGAFSETVYIYGTALDRASQLLSKEPAESPSISPRTLSLGLGLGYVEILASAYAAKNGQTPKGESFELVDELTASFQAWVYSRPEQLVPHSLYDDVARRTSEITGITVGVGEIRAGLAKSLDKKDWVLRPAMTLETIFEQKFSCVAFDAFSSKSTPELWSREFLDRFLSTACEQTCVLSTYACTGHLKRALVDAGFTLEIREGYASKRDSTLAHRA